MDGAELRLARELRASIEAQIEAEALYLANGNAPDFSDYRHRVGKIEGLRLAIAEMDFIHDRVTGRVTERGNV